MIRFLAFCIFCIGFLSINASDEYTKMMTEKQMKIYNRLTIIGLQPKYRRFRIRLIIKPGELKYYNCLPVCATRGRSYRVDCNYLPYYLIELCSLCRIPFRCARVKSSYI